jgi:hypothetical protein
VPSRAIVEILTGLSTKLIQDIRMPLLLKIRAISSQQSEEGPSLQPCHPQPHTLEFSRLCKAVSKEKTSQVAWLNSNSIMTTTRDDEEGVHVAESSSFASLNLRHSLLPSLTRGHKIDDILETLKITSYEDSSAISDGLSDVSQLCLYCQNLYDRWPSPGEKNAEKLKFQHCGDRSSILESAAGGCSLCSCEACSGKNTRQVHRWLVAIGTRIPAMLGCSKLRWFISKAEAVQSANMVVGCC